MHPVLKTILFAYKETGLYPATLGQQALGQRGCRPPVVLFHAAFPHEDLGDGKEVRERFLQLCGSQAFALGVIDGWDGSPPCGPACLLLDYREGLKVGRVARRCVFTDEWFLYYTPGVN